MSSLPDIYSSKTPKSGAPLSPWSTVSKYWNIKMTASEGLMGRLTKITLNQHKIYWRIEWKCFRIPPKPNTQRNLVLLHVSQCRFYLNWFKQLTNFLSGLRFSEKSHGSRPKSYFRTGIGRHIYYLYRVCINLSATTNANNKFIN